MIDKFNKELKHFVVINNKGDFDTIFGQFKPFSGDYLLCPIYNIIKSCICTIGNINNNIKKEFGPHYVQFLMKI